jgi:hypothetical protein
MWGWGHDEAISILRRRQESLPDDHDRLDAPAGKDSCRRSRMVFSTDPIASGQTHEKTT